MTRGALTGNQLIVIGRGNYCQCLFKYGSLFYILFFLVFIIYYFAYGVFLSVGSVIYLNLTYLFKGNQLMDFLENENEAFGAKKTH